MLIHIGIDDTDSPEGGCTTYVAALLIERLLELGVKFVDYPNLIRLNPNIPWKTRGNGAVCLRFEASSPSFDQIFKSAIEVVESNADLTHRGTNPGVVALRGSVPSDVSSFSARVIRDVVKLEEAMSLIRKYELAYWSAKEGRGLIGALAAVGEQLLADHTFELIAYREASACGASRKVNASSVLNMSIYTVPATFNNIDLEMGRILITPRGPDPVLYGIRGETPEAVRHAHSLVKVGERIERWVIFRTNHGTDSHFSEADSLSPFRSVILRGEVIGRPRIIQGGHVLFQLRTELGSIECAAYKPTGVLRDMAAKLAPGHVIEAYGAVRPFASRRGITLNLEKVKVLKLEQLRALRNPVCPRCGRRMKSMGRGKGFRCKRCKHEAPQASKLIEEVPKQLREVLYIASPRARRHLTKPYSRYGREKKSYEPPKNLNPTDFCQLPRQLLANKL